MFQLNDLKMRTKFVLVLLAVGLIPFVVGGVVAMYMSKDSLQTQIFAELTAVREIKKDQVQQYFHDLYLDMQIFSGNREIVELTQNLQTLVRAEELPDAGRIDISGQEYDRNLRTSESNLKRLTKGKGLHKMFIIEPQNGYILFATQEGPEVGTSLAQGQFKQSNLADLWKQVISTRDFAMVDYAPYAPDEGQPALFIGHPIFDKQQETIGVLAAQLSGKKIQDIMQTHEGMGQTGEVYLVGPDMLMRSDSLFEPDRFSVSASFTNPEQGRVDTLAVKEALAGNSGTTILTDYLGNSVLSAYTPFTVHNLTWAIIAEINKDEAFAPIARLQWTMGMVGLAGVVFIILLAILFARSITRPISYAERIVQKIAAGDFTQRVKITQKDEIGVVAQSLNTMMDSLKDMMRQITEGVETLSASSTELFTISEHMTANADQASQKSRSVASAAEEMSTNMNVVAAAAEQASTNIASIASGSEEMTATINEIARNTEKSRHITEKAVSEAKNASNVVRRLGDAAQEIGKFTETITEISEQTNLLALNATIEAARAGDAGKGFAVVANEIKELAKQTAVATQEIRKEIKGIQTSSTDTVHQIEQITTVINEVNEYVTSVASAVEEQSITTQEMAENISQASQGLNEATQNISEISAVSGDIAGDIAEVNQAAEEISSNSAEVYTSAQELNKLSENLKEMTGFFKISE
ncbi:MAG: methyl-accepting chemotaxis protein [Desulfovermiculus sp.]|nr:methyl-accepting chemotaxis protein [Desulfovermiculus sp.]